MRGKISGDFRKWSKGVRTGIAGNVALGILAVALSLAAVWLTREIVDAACHSEMSRLRTLGVVLCAVFLTRLLASKLSQRLEAWCLTRFSNRMRGRIFSVIMRGRYDNGQGMPSGDLVNRLMGDVGSVASVVCSTIPSAMVTLVSLVGSFAFLACIAPGVALAVTLLMPVAIVVGKISMKRSHRLTKQIREEESRIFQLINEDVRNRLLVATLGYTGAAEEEFRKSQSRFFSLTMRRNDLGLIAGGAVAFGFMAGYAVMFLYCAYGLADGSVSYASMTALLQLVAMVQRPSVDLSHKFSPLVRASVSYKRIKEIEWIYGGDFDAGIRIADGDAIRFEHVRFAYGDDGDCVFDDFSESVPTGKATAIYGATGSGKTTAIRLLLGIYRPLQGEIISPFGIGVENLIYVPQGNSLMSGTIHSNLLMGKPDAGDPEIREALTMAAAEFVYELPEGLSKRCGENGDGLSEGQAQRIAIARGVLRLMAMRKEGIKNILVLLDEPTSALDEDTERRLCERLMPYLGGVTVVIITHKQLPGRYADKTIHLKK